MPRAHRDTRSAVLAVAGGVVLGIAGLLPLACTERKERPFEEREERRPPATPAEVATWAEQLEKRGSRWFPFPDPPGEGPVEKRTYALGHESHRLEVRLRGQRVTMGIHGIDPQDGGGGWLAFGEGTAELRPVESNEETPPPCARLLSARISWSCLGTKLNSGNEGVARLVFARDADAVHATYLGYGEPEVWMKSYGSASDGSVAAIGTLKSQIPATPLLPPLLADATYRVRVRVQSFGGGVVGSALVQVKGHPTTQAVTDEEGGAEIAFRGRDAPRAQAFAAGALGYRNGETVVFSDDAVPGWVAGGLAPGTVVIELQRMDLTDHPGYRWQHPAPDKDSDDLMACGACHKWHYDQWQGSRHARSADNGHVAYERERMLLGAPEAPDDCRGCHQPGDASDPRRPRTGWEPRGLTASNHCDLCHKVHHVEDLRESGVYGALAFARPDPRATDRPGGIHHVFGASGDVTNAFMGASWNPLFATSHLCAACHQGGGRWREGALPKVDTFEEWREWAGEQGAAEQQGQGRARSCQDCHMPAGVTKSDLGKPVDQFAWDCLHRSPAAVHEHRFEGSGAAFAAAALEVKVAKKRVGATWEAEVQVTNVGAGHRIPTGTWTKHVLVGVWARQGDRWLRQVDGDRALTVAGPSPVEALAAGDWRNPGGLVLGVRAADEPSGALRQPDPWLPWKSDEIVDDRLRPGATRRARCVFAAEGDAEPTVVVRVVHRRGELGPGPAHTPWKPAPYDEPPEVLWLEVVR